MSSDTSTAFFDFFRQNWRVLFLVLCIIGFALDIIVYLARWRPRLLMRKRRRRQVREKTSPYTTYNDAYNDTYDVDDSAEPYPAYDADASAAATLDYASAFVNPEDAYGTEPTAQYQIQSRQNGQALNAPPATLPYTTPYFAPEFSADQESAPALYSDESAQAPPYAPAAEPQRFAFGMAPSFGSAQSEPAYHYPRDTAPTFAPPRYAREYDPADVNMAMQPDGQLAGIGDPMQPQASDRPSPISARFRIAANLIFHLRVPEGLERSQKGRVLY